MQVRGTKENLYYLTFVNVVSFVLKAFLQWTNQFKLYSRPRRRDGQALERGSNATLTRYWRLGKVAVYWTDICIAADSYQRHTCTALCLVQCRCGVRAVIRRLVSSKLPMAA